MREKLQRLILSLCFGAGALILILSFISFRREDFFLYTSSPNPQIQNFIGIIGVYLAGFSFFLLGWAAFFLPLFLFYLGLKHTGLIKRGGVAESIYTKIFSFFLLLISLSLLFSLHQDGILSFQRGGFIGFLLSSLFLKYLGFWGSFIFVFLIFIIGVSLLWGQLVLETVELVFNKVSSLLKKTQERISSLKKSGGKRVSKKPKINLVKTPQIRPQPQMKVNIERVFQKKEVLPEEEKLQPSFEEGYVLPSSSLLKEPPSIDERKIKEDIKLNARNLEETFSDFGISARVVNVERGPVVTLYEVEPAPGVKITRIASLADDIALAMKSSGVRVVAPLPGKGTVGIEVPNTQAHIVFLREVLESKEFLASKSKLTLAIGRDVSGSALVADLKEMPHLLIAGTTGSGKTVCVNSLISSILFKAYPWEVKFLLIDPKMVELAHFVDIPHLFSPIVSEAKKASAILLWAVEEMERRYSLLAEEGARNIEIYNSRRKKDEKMPFIVIVVDELADLMVVSRDQIETAILRLAQLSRAVGIHLILATQRPSVDVITGVIKANFPARISFKVASKVDSRTVLDLVGAEKLLGRGDLLFIRPGLQRPVRAQASFLEDEDIGKLVRFIKNQQKPHYNQEIFNLQKRSRVTLQKDELFEEAVKIVLEANQASASILQRRLRVGYTRAARLLDLMEEEGIVGPFQGSKPRSILVDREEWLKKIFSSDSENN